MRPCHDNTYKYSPKDYAHILSFSFFVAAFLSKMASFFFVFFLLFLIFLLLLCILSSIFGQDRPFHQFCQNHIHLCQLILDRRDYLYNLLIVRYYNHCRYRRQINCITNVFGSNCPCLCRFFQRPKISLTNQIVCWNLKS